MEHYQRPKKRSLTLRGHRTSVTLEDEFWNTFKSIAEKKSLSTNQLAVIIDTERGLECGLGSAIRLYVLNWVKNEA